MAREEDTTSSSCAELSRYYEQMKCKFDRHVDWLRGQIGSYQAFRWPALTHGGNACV